jgi:hypothetical protein
MGRADEQSELRVDIEPLIWQRDYEATAAQQRQIARVGDLQRTVASQQRQIARLERRAGARP